MPWPDEIIASFSALPHGSAATATAAAGLCGHGSFVPLTKVPRLSQPRAFHTATRAGLGSGWVVNSHEVRSTSTKYGLRDLVGSILIPRWMSLLHRAATRTLTSILGLCSFPIWPLSRPL